MVINVSVMYYKIFKCILPMIICVRVMPEYMFKYLNFLKDYKDIYR